MVFQPLPVWWQMVILSSAAEAGCHRRETARATTGALATRTRMSAERTRASGARRSRGDSEDPSGIELRLRTEALRANLND
jgi:hypothetical protein